MLDFYGLQSIDQETWAEQVSLAPDIAALPETVPGDADPLGLKGEYSKDIGSRRLSVSRDQAILLSSPSFSPREFFAKVHAETDYSSVQRGIANLESAINGSADALKDLVKANFDKFVSAKNTIDELHVELEERLFSRHMFGLDEPSASIQGTQRIRRAAPSWPKPSRLLSMLAGRIANLVQPH